MNWDKKVNVKISSTDPELTLKVKEIWEDLKEELFNEEELASSIFGFQKANFSKPKIIANNNYITIKISQIVIINSEGKIENVSLKGIEFNSKKWIDKVHDVLIQRYIGEEE